VNQEAALTNGPRRGRARPLPRRDPLRRRCRRARRGAVVVTRLVPRLVMEPAARTAPSSSLTSAWRAVVAGSSAVVAGPSAAPTSSAVSSISATIAGASAGRAASAGLLLLLVDDGYPAVGVSAPAAGTSPGAPGHSRPRSSAGTAGDGWNQWRWGFGDFWRKLLELVEWGRRLRSRRWWDPLWIYEGRRAPAKIEHGRYVFGRKLCSYPWSLQGAGVSFDGANGGITGNWSSQVNPGPAHRPKTAR
jgi:hypothetical protein